MLYDEDKKVSRSDLERIRVLNQVFTISTYSLPAKLVQLNEGTILTIRLFLAALGEVTKNRGDINKNNCVRSLKILSSVKSMKNRAKLVRKSAFSDSRN